LTDKDLYSKGWRGQVPPEGFQKLKTKAKPKISKTPTISEIIGSKLSYISPIDKMNKAESMIPIISDANCLQCGRCYLACSDSGY